MGSAVSHDDSRVITEAHLALALEAAEMGAWAWDPASGQVTWSPSLERLHGIPAGAFPGTFDAYQRDIHPDDRERVLAAIERTVRERTPHALEYRIVRPDGAVRWVEARGQLMLDEAGRAARLVGVCMDVTARHEAEIRREQADRGLAEATRLALLTRDVAVALTQPGELRNVLLRCAQTVVDHLGAAFARIWTLNPAENVLELQVSAGIYTHVDGPHSRVPVGQYKIGLIAQERRPHLTNEVIGDPRVHNQEWARGAGMVAFAGYPLVINDRLVGVLAMFSRQRLSDSDFDGLGTVANALALGIARARSEAEIRRSEERYRFLAEAAPIQVWTATPAGVTEFGNTAARDYFGVDLATLDADAQRRLVHPEDAEEAFARWEQALAANIPLDFECRLQRHDREYRWHIIRARPLLDPSGRVVKWFGTSTDIHERKMIRIQLAARAEELARTAAALQRSNHELDQFAYIASHDLKAPLRGIANLSQWIEEDLGGAITDATRGHLTLLRGRVRRMEALIDGILEYSRAGRSSERPERIAVRRVVGEVIELIAAPGHVEFDVAADLPILETHRLPLQQVFLNLLGNAVKHGATRPDARVEVRAQRVPEGYAFTVTDNGPGIPPAFHDKIWGIFQTLAPRDRVEGTGIGLALVKKIVENRGGRVWVESAEGAGAAFGFTWGTERHAT